MPGKVRQSQMGHEGVNDVPSTELSDARGLPGVPVLPRWRSRGEEKGFAAAQPYWRDCIASPQLPAGLL